MNKSQCISASPTSDFWKKKEIVSFLLSILVVLIHVSSFAQYSLSLNLEDNVSNFVNFMDKVVTDCFTRYAVPLYFIISGALFFRDYDDKKYFVKIKKRISTIFVPYIIWNVLGLLFAIGTSYTFISNYFIGREKFVISVSSVLNAIFHHGCNGVFWFIFNLMFFILISPVINKVIRNRYVGIAVTLLVAILCLFDIGLPEAIFTYPVSIVYYMVGAIIGKHFFEGFCKKSSLKTQIVSLVILLTAGVLFYFMDELDTNPIFAFIFILCAWAFWNAADLFVSRFPSFPMVKNSFAIYALHSNLLSIFAKLLFLLLPKNGWMALPNFILTLSLTLIFIRLFCYVLNKLSPKLFKIITGGR